MWQNYNSSHYGIRRRKYAVYLLLGNCVSKLENMFGSFSFDNGEEIKEYWIIIFVTIRAYGGRTYNSLSLLSVLEDEYTSQQTNLSHKLSRRYFRHLN